MIRGRQRRRDWAWKVLALVLAGLAGLYFSRGLFLHLRKTYPPNAFHQVKRADLLISVVEDGALRALNETVVRSGLEGFNRIIQLVPEGSYVQKGDLLVELDSAGLKDRLNEQELLHQDRLFQMAQAKGNLSIQRSMADSQIKDGEWRLENAQADFEKYRDADAPFLIRTVEARSAILSEQVRIARERHVRTEELAKAGNATRSELEADALSLKREQVGFNQYQEDLRLIKKYDQPNQLRLLQSKVEQAKAELERLRQRTSNEIAQAEADLKTSQGALEFLEENLATLRQRLASTRIVAPQNGLVVYSQVSPFQFGGGDERRREDGRLRTGPGNGDFRGGGGRRGNRMNNDNNSRGSSSVSSSAETVSSGYQRIASAVSGSSVTDPNGGRGGANGSGDAGGSSGGGDGQSVSAAGAGFATYASMRPSSAFSASRTATNSSSTGGGAAAAISLVSTGGQNSSFNQANNLTGRSGGQNYRDFGGFDSYGTPGILEAGMMVRQRQELIRLPDVSKMLAEIKIAEGRVAEVHAGMTAYIQVRNIPHRRFKGTVRRVALLPDAQASWMNPDTKVFPADILVEEELPILKPGVSASVEILITNLTQVLSVPIQTVARLNGEKVCFIKKGLRVAPVLVTTGWSSDAFVEIRSGLKEGDLVLLAPATDEESDDSDSGETETNAVETVPSPNGPEPPAGALPAESRKWRGRETRADDGENPSERPRGRPGGGRRSPNPPDSPPSANSPNGPK